MLRRIEKSQGCHTPRLDGVHRFVPVEGERWGERKQPGFHGPRRGGPVHQPFLPQVEFWWEMESPKRFELLRRDNPVLCLGRSISLSLTYPIVGDRGVGWLHGGWNREWGICTVTQDLTLDSVLSYCLLNLSMISEQGPAFSFCPEPHKLCSCSCLPKGVWNNSECPT